MYGHRARIGYTSPPVLTEVFPYEFYRIAPEGVTLLITTLTVKSATPEELQDSYEISLGAAREMGKAGVDLVVLGGVPINLCRGVDKVDELIQSTEEACGVPVTTSVTAQLNALQKLGAKRLGVVSLAGEATLEYEYLERGGYQIVASKNVPEMPPLNYMGRASSDISMNAAWALAKEHPEIDTLYFPCPHRPTIDMIQEIEEELDINIVTASQAIIWEALRRCDIRDPVSGYGRLFDDGQSD